MYVSHLVYLQSGKIQRCDERNAKNYKNKNEFNKSKRING